MTAWDIEKHFIGTMLNGQTVEPIRSENGDCRDIIGGSVFLPGQMFQADMLVKILTLPLRVEVWPRRNGIEFYLFPRS